MLYPNEYVWFIFVSSMDVMLTWMILLFGGSEVNPIADYFIQRGQLVGMIVYKFSIMLFVIMVCEIIGRLRSERGGRWLIRLGILISAVPIVWSFALLLTAAKSGTLEPIDAIEPGWRVKPAQLLSALGTLK